MSSLKGIAVCILISIIFFVTINLKLTNIRLIPKLSGFAKPIQIESFFWISPIDTNLKSSTSETVTMNVPSGDTVLSINPVFNSTLHIYTIDGKPILFLYWNSNQTPPHIQLSLETIKCHSHNDVHIILANPQFVQWQLNNTVEEFPWLIPAYQADYFRSFILLKYGGMYMDLDTIQTNSVRYLFDHLVKFDIFGADWTPDKDPISMPVTGPMRAGNLLLQKWKPKVDKILRDKHDKLKRNYMGKGGKYPIEWTEILGGIWLPIMNQLLANKQINYTFVDGLSTCGQIVKGFLNDLFKPSTSVTLAKAKRLNFSVDYLYYHNSHIKRNLGLSMDEFLNNNYLYTEIIKKALSQCKAWRNGLYDSDLVQKLNISAFNDFSL